MRTQISRNVNSLRQILLYMGMCRIQHLSLHPVPSLNISRYQEYQLPLEVGWNFGSAALRVAGGHHTAPRDTRHTHKQQKIPLLNAGPAAVGGDSGWGIIHLHAFQRPLHANKCCPRVRKCLWICPLALLSWLTLFNMRPRTPFPKISRKLYLTMCPLKIRPFMCCHTS